MAYKSFLAGLQAGSKVAVVTGDGNTPNQAYTVRAITRSLVQLDNGQMYSRKTGYKIINPGKIEQWLDEPEQEASRDSADTKAATSQLAKG